MTLAQIAFLVLWPSLSVVGIVAAYRNKKHNGKERIFFSVIFILVPILSAMLYLLVTYRATVFFWSNSATKDQMWIADSDIGHDSAGGDSGTTGGE